MRSSLLMTPLKSKKIAWIIDAVIRPWLRTSVLLWFRQFVSFHQSADSARRTREAAVRSPAHPNVAALPSVRFHFLDSPGNRVRHAFQSDGLEDFGPPL